MSMNGFRSRIRSFILGKRPDDTPIVMTEWGPVNESARKQAAINMKLNPEVRQRVEEHFAKQCGSVALGLLAAKKQFPECYEED